MARPLTILWVVAFCAAQMLHPGGATAQTTNGFASQLVTQPQVPVTPQPGPAPNAQAISQTGLLPLFAVDLQIDPSWIDSSDVPSKSPQFSHSGVNDTFQKAWDALKPSGFNMVRFQLDPADPAAPARLANLCIWAKANNVSLIPVLKYVRPDRNDKSAMASAIGVFASTVVSRMHQQDASVFTDYTQIAYYQLEDSMNHLGIYPKMTPDTAQQLLVSSADALRNSETQALQGTQVQPTPILIAASFDYELIKQGAIAGIPLDSNAEQRARASLKQYLSALASATNIDAFNVEWLPRSISSGDVDHFAPFLRDLKTSIAKQLSLTTGFSTAFNSPDQQSKFFTLAFTNLADFRATDGPTSNFLGVVFRQAFTGPQASTKPPSTSGDPAQWNWNDKAQQLLAMWSQGTTSDALSWWISKVQDNLGMLTLQPNSSGGMDVVPLSAQQAIQQISSTIAQVSQNVPAPPTMAGATSFTSPQSSAPLPPGSAMPQNAAPPYSAAMGTPPSTATGGSPTQQFLLTILQQFTTQMTTALASKLSGTGTNANQFNNYNPANLNSGIAGQVSPYPSNTTPYVTAPYAPGQMATQPPSQSLGAPTYPAQPQPYATGVATPIALGPQDISVDVPNPVLGQAVNVIAQVHNTSPNQDASGLTATLVNPAGVLPNQPSQGGIYVPRSGTTPVQFSWIAPNSGVFQLQLQVSDSTGAQLASVPVPTISVGNQAVVGGTGTAISTQSSGPTTGFTSSTAGSSSVQPGNPVGGQPSSQTASSSPGQPQIAFFGIVDSSSPATAGQLAPLLLQIANPSAAPLSPMQAQLFIDGNLTQNQALGPLLPGQTRSAMFSGIPGAPGTHSARVLVLTADGASASASASVNAAIPVTSNPSGTTTAQPGVTAGVGNNLVGKGPRTWTPAALTPIPVPSPGAKTATSFQNYAASSPQISTGSPSGSATSASATSTPTITPRAVASPQAALGRSGSGSANASGTSQSVPPTSTSSGAGTSRGSSSNTVRTITPSSPPNSSGSSGSSAAPRSISGGSGSTGNSSVGQTGQVRTITPGNTGGATANAKSSAKSSSGGTAGSPSSSPPSAGSQARTITPGNTKTASNSSSNSSSSTHSNKSSSATSGATPSAPAKQGASSTSKQGTIDLSVSSADLRINPSAPRAGQSIVVTASIHNLGTSPAQGASVVFRLLAGSQVVAASQPMVFNLAARGTFQASWSTVVPQGRQFGVVVVVAANGDVNTANNQAGVAFNVAAGPR